MKKTENKKIIDRGQLKEGKPCRVCGLPFTVRKKWKNIFDGVYYCSEACKAKRKSLGIEAVDPAISKSGPVSSEVTAPSSGGKLKKPGLSSRAQKALLQSLQVSKIAKRTKKYNP
jgi:hypothetical protein